MIETLAAFGADLGARARADVPAELVRRSGMRECDGLCPAVLRVLPSASPSQRVLLLDKRVLRSW